MQKIMLYVLRSRSSSRGIPFLVGVIYWSTSNLWTMGQRSTSSADAHAGMPAAKGWKSDRHKAIDASWQDHPDGEAPE